MTSPSSSAMIGGPCSSSVAVTNAVKPEISARTSIPSSVWLFIPLETPATGIREARMYGADPAPSRLQGW